VDSDLPDNLVQLTGPPGETSSFAVIIRTMIPVLLVGSRPLSAHVATAVAADRKARTQERLFWMTVIARRFLFVALKYLLNLPKHLLINDGWTDRMAIDEPDKAPQSRNTRACTGNADGSLSIRPVGRSSEPSSAWLRACLVVQSRTSYLACQLDVHPRWLFSHVRDGNDTGSLTWATFPMNRAAAPSLSS
jgi:hypothetical protein